MPMDASSAAKAFDADTTEGFVSPAPLLRVVRDAAAPAQAPAPLPDFAQPSVEREPSASRFGAKGRVNWAAIGIIAGLHVALAAALVTMDVVKLKTMDVQPMLVDLIPSAPPPSPPEPVLQPQLEVIPQVIVPPQLDILPPRESPVQAVVAETPPPVSQPAVAVSTPAPAAPSSGSSSVAVADLSSTMISAEAPRYPVESRRKKEEGTVVLLVTVGPDGKVADIRVSRSSGFDRLDNAALSAVKKWRWSPTLRGGQPVSVRGYVEIPFVLKKS